MQLKRFKNKLGLYAKSATVRTKFHHNYLFFLTYNNQGRCRTDPRHCKQFSLRKWTELNRNSLMVIKVKQTKKNLDRLGDCLCFCSTSSQCVAWRPTKDQRQRRFPWLLPGPCVEIIWATRLNGSINQGGVALISPTWLDFKWSISTTLSTIPFKRFKFSVGLYVKSEKNLAKCILLRIKV